MVAKQCSNPDPFIWSSNIELNGAGMKCWTAYYKSFKCSSVSLFESEEVCVCKCVYSNCVNVYLKTSLVSEGSVFECVLKFSGAWYTSLSLC